MFSRSQKHEAAYLRICRPVGQVFQPLTNVRVFQDVERLEANLLISQQADQGSAEATPRGVRSALHEQHRFRAEREKKNEGGGVEIKRYVPG